MEPPKSGILDNSTQEIMVLNDDKITFRTSVKVYGVLEAGLIRATEVIADQRYEKQYLEFASPHGNIGSGLLWSNPAGNHQFVLRTNPSRFWASEAIDIPQNQSFMIGGTPAIGYNFLGNNITDSNIQTLGNLKALNVNGRVNFGDNVYYNPFSQRFSIGLEESNAKFSVYDGIYDVEVVVGTTDSGNGKIGTYNTKSLDIITDNQSRITVDAFGNVTFGHETRDNTITRVYGKLSIGIKNPKESLEVAGNIRWSNKLFEIGASIPTTGTYQKGDIVWNTEPKPNNYIGWVCILSGTPGKWKSFGLITP